MTDALTLNLPAVETYLRQHLPGFAGPITAEKFQIGQSNPTFMLKTPAQTFVLRRKPPGQLLKSAHAVDREYRVQRALAPTDVPVPKMHLLCQDQSVIGSVFYVMDLVAGRNFNLPTLDALTPADRMAVTCDMARVLATLHNVDLNDHALADYGPPGDYIARQINRWSKQYRATETDSLPDMEALMDAMQKHMPPDDGQRTLVHGDFRIDNMMFAQDGTHCVALLDWELSTTGHPFADLASVLMQWQLPGDANGRGLAGVDRAAHGLPSDAEFIAAYESHRGQKTGDLRFYVAFCFFRMAAILQGVYRRALDGNASNPAAGLRLGAMIPALAAKGCAAVDGD